MSMIIIMRCVRPNINTIHTSPPTHCPSFVFFHPLSISDCPCEAAWLWYPLLPRGSGARHPHFATVPSQSLVMATLAPAVVACAHRRPLAQSLSHPIYLTQTRVSRPGPAYLSSAWFILGTSSSPVPLHSGICNKMRGWGGGPLCLSRVVCERKVFVKQFVRCCLRREMAITDIRENNWTHCGAQSHS